MDFKKQVAKDIAQITSTDFAIAITFTPPGGMAKVIPGYAGKHSLNVNEIGFKTVNSKKAHCTVSEINMLAAGYVTRNEGDLINFTDHLVTWTDQSGQTKTYIIQKGAGQPDENNGALTFILGNYEIAS